VTATRDLSLRRFLEEATQEVTSLEHSKLLRTVGALLFRPGLLSTEYFTARRVRFLRPLALTLGVLALHLFAFSISDTVSMFDVRKFGVTQERMQAGTFLPRDHLVSSQISREAAQRRVNPRLLENEINDKWARNASLLQIPLILLFALVLKLIHLRSRRFAVEHLVFSMHTISFTVLTVVMMWPIYFFAGTEITKAGAAVAIVKGLIDIGWLTLATRTFYGYSLRKAVVLGLLSFLGYYVAFGITYQLAMTLALRSTFAGS
jgi:hypothetical protein